MNTVFILKFQLADIISVLNGVLVFISVMLAGSNNWRKRRWAWGLGLSVQLGLILFGWLTDHYGFFTSVIPMWAFAWNLWRSYYPKETLDKKWSDDARHRLQEDLVEHVTDPEWPDADTEVNDPWR